MSQNRGFLFSESEFCHFQDIKYPKTAQNMQNICNDVPKTEFLILRINVLGVWGHATFYEFSITLRISKKLTRNMLTKNEEKSRCQIWRNVIILLSFCYHLENDGILDAFLRHHLSCEPRCMQKSLVEIWQIVIIVLSFLLITFQQENASVGAFF